MLRLRFQGRVFFQKSVHIVRTDVDILFGIAVVDKPGSLGLLLRRIAADEEEVAGFNNIKADNPAGTGLRIILIGAKSSQVSPSPFSASCRTNSTVSCSLLSGGEEQPGRRHRIRLKTISNSIRFIGIPSCPSCNSSTGCTPFGTVDFAGSIISVSEADVKKEGKERTKRIRSFLEFVFLDYEIDVNILLIFFAFSGTIKKDRFRTSLYVRGVLILEVIQDILAAIGVVLNGIPQGPAGTDLRVCLGAYRTGLRGRFGGLRSAGFSGPISFQAETIVLAGNMGKDRRDRLSMILFGGVIMVILGLTGTLSAITAFAGDAIVHAMMAGVGFMLVKVAFGMVKENRLVGWVSVASAVIIYLVSKALDPSNALVYTIVGSLIISSIAAKVAKQELGADAVSEKCSA